MSNKPAIHATYSMASSTKQLVRLSFAEVLHEKQGVDEHSAIIMSHETAHSLVKSIIESMKKAEALPDVQSTH